MTGALRKGFPARFLPAARAFSTGMAEMMTDTETPAANKRRRHATLKLTMPSVAEAKEQEWLFEWRTKAGIRRWPELRWLHAIPNGMAASSVGTASRMKRQGMTKGIPDVYLPVARNGFHGLYMEMKRRDGTLRDLSPEQRDCLAFLREQGYQACVAFGWRDAVKILEAYLTVEGFSQPSPAAFTSANPETAADRGSPLATRPAEPGLPETF